jgi:arylsulfatase A-like enzyme
MAASTIEVGWRTARLARRALLAAAVAAATLAAPAPARAGEQKPPNIVLVVADDLAAWATGLTGAPHIVTPTLDALAAGGLQMVNAAAVAPVCSPSRASLLTGRLPSQHGVHDFLREEAGRKHDWLAGEILLPELLRQAGYRTALIGKWHLDASRTEPARGFDRWLSYDVTREGWRNQYQHRGAVYLSDDGAPITATGFQTSHLIDAAIQWVSRQGETQPFFLMLAPTDTHVPYEGLPERWISRYRDPELLDLVRTPPGLLPPANDAARAGGDLPELLAEYLAGVSHQDAELGRLVDALDVRGLLDATLIVFTSDQGLMLGQKGLVGKGNATLPQNLFEESIRVPMVLHWPARIPAGSRLAIPFDHIDLFQSLLDAAGVQLAPETAARINSPGSSVLPYPADPSTGWRRWRYAEYGTVRAIADQRYKLIVRSPPLLPGYGDELYDLLADPGETRDLALSADHRAVEQELHAALVAHFARHSVPGRDGFSALEQPPQNGNEPWRRMAAGAASPSPAPPR